MKTAEIRALEDKRAGVFPSQTLLFFDCRSSRKTDESCGRIAYFNNSAVGSRSQLEYVILQRSNSLQCRWAKAQD
jgi:hypothetical protein